MRYEEALLFLEKAAEYGSRPGLETIRELTKRLGNPQDKLKIIHIAGTNGKGSTAAYITTILAFAGFSVGRFLSPAVFDRREIIQISHSSNGRLFSEYITEEGICRTVGLIKRACEEMVRDGFAHPTVFEIETAMAFLYLSDENVDFAVIETGMGGRLDATNVIDHPLCSVITSISMDHMQYLGDTLEEISRHKAGIIKSGAPAISINTDQRVLKVLEEECKGTGSSLILASAQDAVIHNLSCEGTVFSYKGNRYKIGLLGKHQVENAILALETVRVLRSQGFAISQEAICTGLARTRWRGRFEIIAREPYFIIDGAHNEDAAVKLREAIETYFAGRRLIFIMGIFADKEYRKVLKTVAPLSQLLITIAPPNSRALKSDSLAREAKNYFDGRIIDAGTAKAAIDYAYANSRPEDVIVAFGSLSFLQELSECLKKRLQDQRA